MGIISYDDIYYQFLKKKKLVMVEFSLTSMEKIWSLESLGLKYK